MGSGSTVWSEGSTGVGLGASGTFARPPALASRNNEIFIPRKMEFKGWTTDCTRSSFQGINEEVMVFIVDLQKLILGQFHQYIDWNQSRKEQVRPRRLSNMWFKNETNLATMIGLFKVVKERTEKTYKIRNHRSLQDWK